MNVKARSASVSSKSSEIATMAAAMNSASSETISPWTTQKKKFDFSPESKSANTGQSEDATAGESNDDADKKQQNRSSTGSGQVAGTLTRKKSLSDKFRMGINATLQHKPKEGPTQSTEAKKAEMRAVENAIGELLLQLDMHTSIVQALERQIDRAEKIM
ncbi:hypothetical protein SARC_11949 [Sphaeroforma arctica JP610]|uniref:Uncharacterized protein n=1 Tax=Sphaeroforma arctica JP610 TaxID=667725 RepID=A0A0L0FHL5_9EUKA|nr:hypothetical protein SARC_11949 [Sphaeroforma arctica JP610]KNC75528.1 hypothetical protein SARC_11949 [Sphaeroforma arctica JP610]|eukprot:XP_014149430.1 hypothetical protein SARC_11949 [Sphaeroforma arctica JP610]